VALAERASMFERLAQYARAEQDLDAAVTYGRSAQSLTARAEFLSRRPDRTEAALIDLTEATELDGTYHAAFYIRGLVLARLRRSDEADRAFDRVIALEPDSEAGLLMRGKMAQALGNAEAAAKDVLAAMMLSPELAQRTMAALRHAGYWIYRDLPSTVTPE